jgi:hypothetical protein
MKKLMESKIFALTTVIGISTAILLSMGLVFFAIHSGATFLLAPVAVVVIAELTTATTKMLKG